MIYNDPKIQSDHNHTTIYNRDLLGIFEAHRNPTVDPHYNNRAERNSFAARQLKTAAVGSILNIGGGGRRHLEKCLDLPKIRVFEVDIQGECDLQANLDELAVLPFESESYDVVCAFDVLEHLENFHLINEEIYRVAKDHVLISLPNSASEVFYNPFRNRKIKENRANSGVFSTFYGLPLEPPEDRHRWWLYFQDIVRYYYYFANKNDANLEFWTPRLNFKKRIFKALFGSHLYYTFFCQHVWIKLTKRPR